jgi:hypothetical protein
MHSMGLAAHAGGCAPRNCHGEQRPLFNRRNPHEIMTKNTAPPKQVNEIAISNYDDVDEMGICISSFYSNASCVNEERVVTASIGIQLAGTSLRLFRFDPEEDNSFATLKLQRRSPASGPRALPRRFSPRSADKSPGPTVKMRTLHRHRAGRST